jgi:outer membrane lipoprotein-sorting protein
MSSRIAGPRWYRFTAFLLLTFAACFAASCGNQPRAGNANSSSTSANKNAGASPDSRESGTASSVDIKDPDRFGLSMTISAQEINNEPSSMPTLQFGFTKFDADRRWTFSLPSPLGQVVYLEKSGLMYLILSDRKQYVELNPNDLGLQVGRAMTPSAIANQLKARARAEAMGVELVNGRSSRKFRFKSESQTEDGAIYVDIETGLPVRAEVNTTPASGKPLRIIVEGREVQLNPDRSTFDVPAGMKKVSSQEAKQAIDMFAGILKSFSEVLSGSASLPQQPKAIANTNAVRPRR